MDCTHLDKGDLALADVTAAVLDGDLSIVLNPPLTAQDVVDARGDLVPFIVVPKTRQGESE